MKKIVTLIALALVLSACNTINGMGKDIEQAGEAVQKSSK
ncbi:entericidin A/B family lipoprotein [Methylophilus aquaticus]|uniref:Type IV secretion system putative lipoprotein virB7 n=1 Tax=Methylophilus aquaticus TaxID=1971610 RepID=A0ABT9JVJ8_9PROT|nr:entericidin A/B family lipoprotein [Methylophilus aquaticus]MDP8568620.1 entericidin A/B family lipoprotein [Methylophilus aquaticus]